MVFLSKIQ